MKTKTHIKAGGWRVNHNETQTTERTRCLTVKSGVKAGPFTLPRLNHNETQVRDAA